MTKLQRILTFLLTVVFIYSATGQAIVSHYCNIRAAQEKSHCCEKSEAKDCCGEEINTVKANDPCCTTITSYQVNPYSVQKPETKKELSIETSLIEQPVFIYKSAVISAPVSTGHDEVIAPPGRAILLKKSILTI